MHYLDHNATSPLRPESLVAIAHALGVGGNPSSIHTVGRAARLIVEDAKSEIAQLVNAERSSIVFTSGATEANNLALAGAVEGAIDAEARLTRLFVSAIEHRAVSAAAEKLLNVHLACVWGRCRSPAKVYWIPKRCALPCAKAKVAPWWQ